jgi:hypothetical protein
MLVNKILKVVLLLLGGIFIVLQSFALEVEGSAVSTAMLLLLSVLYYKFTENKSSLFFWFLIFFTTAQVISLSSYFLPSVKEGAINYSYYVTNSLYIIAYITLIYRILRKLDIKKVFVQLSIPIIILLVLDVFSLAIFSETTEHTLSSAENNLEYIYNAVVMALLSVALINYMYRNDNKSMLFLLASIFIVFSEIIQFAYYYILEDNNLGLIYSFFLVVAFVFYYLQSQLEFTGPIPEYTDELEA